MKSPAMDINIQIIQKHLTTPEVGSHIRVFKKVTSTNDALRELARTWAPEERVGIAVASSTRVPAHLLPVHQDVVRPLDRGVEPLGIPPRDVAGFSFVASLALSDMIKADGRAWAARQALVLAARRKPLCVGSVPTVERAGGLVRPAD
jgi:hypothetical protein